MRTGIALDTEEYMYTINRTKLSIKDVANLQRSARTSDISEMLPIIEKCVTTEDGSPASELPFEHFNAIVDKILQRLQYQDPNSKGS
jgi:hypothetical protein